MATNLRRLVQRLDPRLLQMGAVALCGIFLGDYPVITAAYTGEKELFRKYCLCTTKRDINEDDAAWNAKVDCLWRLLRTTLLPVLSLVRKSLPSGEPHILFRGVRFRSLDDLKRFIPKIKNNGTLTHLKSWTNSLEVALRFS